MMFDKKALNMLMSLDDEHLCMLIKKLAADSGVDISNVNISQKELRGIRSALSMATDSDIERAGELIKIYKDGKKNG